MTGRAAPPPPPLPPPSILDGPNAESWFERWCDGITSRPTPGEDDVSNRPRESRQPRPGNRGRWLDLDLLRRGSCGAA